MGYLILLVLCIIAYQLWKMNYAKAIEAKRERFLAVINRRALPLYVSRHDAQELVQTDEDFNNYTDMVLDYIKSDPKSWKVFSNSDALFERLQEKHEEETDNSKKKLCSAMIYTIAKRWAREIQLDASVVDQIINSAVELTPEEQWQASLDLDMDEKANQS